MSAGAYACDGASALPMQVRRSWDPTLQEFTAYRFESLDLDGATTTARVVDADVAAAALFDGGSFGFYVLGAVGDRLCRIGAATISPLL